MTIVIAWLEDVEEWNGEPFCADIGQRPKMVSRTVPRSVVWVHGGTEEDRQKAESKAPTLYPDGHGHRVFAYPDGTKNPLERARVEVQTPTDWDAVDWRLSDDAIARQVSRRLEVVFQQRLMRKGTP